MRFSGLRIERLSICEDYFSFGIGQEYCEYSDDYGRGDGI
jgi:hypothetical protein